MCIDGTFVRKQKPSENEADYVNRKGYHAFVRIQKPSEKEADYVNRKGYHA